MKTIVALCILLVALPVYAGTWRDDFEDGNLDGWWQLDPFAPEPTLWKIVDGELECTQLGWATTTDLDTGEENWKDYTIEYVMTQKPFDSLELDKWYRIKLEAKGAKFTFWVNGKMVLEHQDDVAKEGFVSLGLAGYIGRFDNVEISGPDVPDVTPPTWRASPVQPGGKKAMTWGTVKFSR